MAPPRLDIIKINTDAGFDHRLAVGSAGIVARDYKGELVCGFTKRFPATNPLIAEALALREAVAIAVNLRIPKVLFESDCLVLVSACRKESKSGMIMNIVQDILLMAAGLDWYGFTWTAKEGKSVAHQIAKLNLRNLLPVHWCWSMPLTLKECFLRDQLNLRPGLPPTWGSHEPPP